MPSKPKISTEPYKGVRDFYPEDEAVQRYVFSTMRTFVEKCGYVEYNASLLEPAELYRAKNVENEEIINDQTYTFTDRGGREVTLRPEMTPSVARMVASRRRELPFPLRWYSIQNFFRYERPQRGRVREFWQLNVDIFGTTSPAADVELIALAHGLMGAFGAKMEDFEIRLGSRAFINSLCKELKLTENKKRDLLLLLDRKAKISIQKYEEELAKLGIAKEKFELRNIPDDIAKVLTPLRESGFSNIIYDPSVVRGFAYYTGIVFEVFDTHPDNKRALFGGGRYDELLEKFAGEHIPAAGFAAGDVTIVDFLSVRGLLPHYRPTTRVYLSVPDASLVYEAMKLAGELRRAGVNTAVDFGDKKLGNQIKNADKQKIPYLIVVGHDELQSGDFTVKELKTGTEAKITRDELATFFLK